MATKKKASKDAKAPACSKGKSVCDILCKASDKAACPLAKRGRGRPKKVVASAKVSLLAKLRALIGRLLGR